MQTFSKDSQAILLLTGQFSNGRPGDAKPLKPSEYGRLACWLQARAQTPKVLLENFDETAQNWQDPRGRVTGERLKRLMMRGGSMGIALEKWASAGIWVLTRADESYPYRLRKRLGDQAPPLLHGVGEPQLLERGGVAIVGSRRIEPNEEDYAKRIGKQAAQEGLNVVSGGAAGVDELAMRAALEAEGTAVGVLSNGLMKAALSGIWRSFLRRKDLCLLSPTRPEASFQVGQAMGRNKYIYCLADYGLIVRADEGRGGTWSGAEETLEKRFVPIFVNPHSTSRGNQLLLEMGGNTLPLPESPARGAWLRKALESRRSEEGPNKATVASTAAGDIDIFYSAFLKWIEAQLNSRASITLKELEGRHHDVTSAQLKVWLERAVQDDKLERIGRAHRYRLRSHMDYQGNLYC